MTGVIAASITNPNHPLLGNDDPLKRIGMSTVNFRNRFSQTRKPGQSVNEILTLDKIPEYFADRFNLHNVEYWSRHFDSTDKIYLRELKNAIKKSRSKLINIQLDEKYQLGDHDPEIRKESLALVMKWVDVAHQLGSGGLRVNPGKGDPEYAIEALKKINRAAKSKGIVLMTENHFGMEMDPDLHLRIVKEVGDNMYTLPDFGNYPDEDRYSALKKILPYAYQVSAKTAEFDEHMHHVSFDFEKCMKLAINSGFKGIYSVEQWSPESQNVSDEAIADWMIAQVKTLI